MTILKRKDKYLSYLNIENLFDEKILSSNDTDDDSDAAICDEAI